MEIARGEGGGDGFGGKQVQMALDPPSPRHRLLLQGWRWREDTGRRENSHVGRNAVASWASGGRLGLKDRGEMSSSPPLIRISSRTL